MVTVDVLLATYQNANFLKPLLDSLVEQSRKDFRLIVSDDCSTDGTRDMIESYRDRFADMTVINRALPSGSAKANFASLLQHSDADYTLFADADDIWDADKVEIFVNALSEGDRKDGDTLARYVFSDTRIIDGDGAVTGNSYWEYKKLRPSAGDSSSSAMVCPPMLGCASGINRALREMGTPVPTDRVTGHDWWLLLVAKFLGTVDVIDRPTMSYRIHGNNRSNQRKVSLMKYLFEGTKVHRVRRGMRLRQRQAGAVRDAFAASLSPADRKLIDGFVKLDEMNPIAKRHFLLSNGILYPDFPRNLAMMIAA